MARVIPSGLLAILQGSPLAGECLALQARDGTRKLFTALDVPQALDLGEGAGSETYSDGISISALTLAGGLDASYAETQGPLDSEISRALLDGGKWDDAEAWLVRVSPGESGFAPLLYGRVREARVAGNRFVFQIRNQGDDLNPELGLAITAFCRFRFGSADCGGTPVAVSATVSAVTDAMRFAVTFTGTHETGFFNQGEAEFTSGGLDGVIAENIQAWISPAADAASIELFEPLSQAPEVGDTLTVRQGCPKTRAGCIERQGHARNHGGFPDVPGSDLAMQYPG